VQNSNLRLFCPWQKVAVSLHSVPLLRSFGKYVNTFSLHFATPNPANNSARDTLPS
jgi:hypothetical protein